MKALVTGCAGFIGSHLCEALLTQGMQVTGIDCFTKNYSHKTKEENLSEFINKIEFVEENILDADLEAALDGADFVFHLGAETGVRTSWGEDFGDYVKNNILATNALLDACRGKKLKKIVYASSSSIYGDAADFPTRESTIPKPVSPYGVSKLAAEHLCNVFSINYGVPAVSLRFFTVYGPRQRPDMAFNKFAKAISEGNEMTIYGDGMQERDFTFVKDVVDGIIRASKNGKNAEAYNIGAGKPATVMQAISFFEKSLGKKARIKFAEAQPGDVKKTFADVSKAKTDFGYAPTHSLEQGINEYVKWAAKAIK